MMTPETQEHLKLIQTVVARQAANSFVIKGWCLTVVTALYAYALVHGSAAVALTGVAVALLFAFLDVYYLRQERLWRGLYDLVRVGDPAVLLFAMSTASAGGDASVRWRAVARSVPLVAFFGAAVLVGLVVTVRVQTG